MKKRLSCFLLLLLITWHTNAQNNPAPVYEITTDTATIITLPGNYWQIMEDPTDKLKIEQVTSLPVSSKFHTDSSNTKGIDYGIRTNWVRFKFINKMTKPIDLVFLNMKTNRRDMYLFKQGSLWKHLVNGSFVPWSLRDGYKREASIEVNIPAGEEFMVYQRNYVSRPFRKAEAFRYSFMFKEKFLQHEGFTSDNEQPPYLTTLRDGFLLGFLIFAALLTLLFFFIVWQRLYLYYALFLFIYCIAASPLDEITFFREHNYTQYVFEIFAFPVFSFFLVQFIRLFLQTRLHYPRWDKFVNWYSFLCVFISVIIYSGAHSASAKSSDILQDTFYLLTYINLVNMFISFAVSIRKQVASDRPLLYITLPALLAFTSVGLSIPVFLFLQHLFNIDNMSLITKIGDLQQLCDMISISFFALTFFVILFKRYSLLQKEVVLQTLERERLAREKELERNQFIEKQNLELESKVEARTNELRHSIDELKSTQSQLIQAEKMASLGELTAGIAHEIQNPLNFVNNFSEVNTELISEMNDEIEKGNFEDVKAIANDIKENQQKINHHGRRADTIVKGMLQHSRASTGKKETADINALADEYLRLSYHGLRAKDKSFNATMHTYFDESIGNINIVPQDIGRVLLNLYNNAFYAVCEKRNTLLTLKGEKSESKNEYEPTVTVSTKAVKSTSGDRSILISVKDNGNGIPQKAADKIFQPFFTTKPTGQGTGLGLSLSYDIIKAHGGKIKFETREGGFTTFTIQLPAVP